MLITQLFMICFHILLVDGVVQSVTNAVHAKRRVNTVTETLPSNSVRKCTSICSERRATSNSCATATYNSATKTCDLSVNDLLDTSFVDDPSVKTMVVAIFCPPLPTIDDGFYLLKGPRTVTNKVFLVCLPGYARTGPDISTCLDSGGTGVWSELGSCVLNPTGGTAAVNDFMGTSFTTAFLWNRVSNNGIPTLTITSKDCAVVNIDIPFSAYSQTLTVDKTTLELTFSRSLATLESGLVTNKGVRVTSDKPINLFVRSSLTSSVGGTFVLPEAALGTEYITISYPSTSGGSETFVAVGLPGNVGTVITVTTPLGTSSEYTLNSLETIAFHNAGSIGTIINGTGKFAVVSGHTCANIPDNGVEGCDYVVETLIPTSAFGRVFLAGYMYGRTDFSLGLVALFDRTIVDVYDNIGDLTYRFSLGRGESKFRSFNGTIALSVISNENILLMQYSHGGNLQQLGDPAMMIVPSITNYGDRYWFSVPAGFIEPSALTIAVMEADASNVKFDGSPVVPTASQSVIVPNVGTYVIMHLEILAGPLYKLNHGNGQLFAVWLYGRKNNQEYAYSLGMWT